jgi:serine/threonine protein kinase
MLSKGGMGMVYQATHTVLDKPLAFKVMLQPQDEAARQRFLLEAKLAVQVRHRNIVDVVDFGVLSTNQPFLVMEFLVGQTLAELIEQGPIPPADVRSRVSSRLRTRRSPPQRHRPSRSQASQAWVASRGAVPSSLDRRNAVGEQSSRRSLRRILR